MGALSFNEMEIDALGEMMNIQPRSISDSNVYPFGDLPFTSRLQR